MADRTEALVLQMSADIRRMEKALNQVRGTTNRQLGAVEKRFQTMNANILRSTGQLAGQLTATLGGIGLGFAAKETLAYADAWTQAQNKILAAGVSLAELNDVQSELVKISLQTRTSLESTTDLFARLTRSTEQLNVSQEKVFRATTIVNQAFKAGGGSIEEQRAAITQLSQALASGALQGDELRSIRENAPLLAKAIADEFDVTTGQLKKLGAEGKLTTDKIFNGILNAGKAIEAQFLATTATVGESFQNLQTVINQAIGRIDQAFGVSAALRDVINQAAAGLGAGADGELLPQTPRAMEDRVRRFVQARNVAKEQVEALLEEEVVTRELSEAERELAEQRKVEAQIRLNDLNNEIILLRQLAQRFREIEADSVGGKLNLPWTKEALDAFDNLLNRLPAAQEEMIALMERVRDAPASQFLNAGDLLAPPQEEIKKLQQYTTALEALDQAIGNIRASTEGVFAKSRAAVQALISFADATQDIETTEERMRSLGNVLSGADWGVIFNHIAGIRKELEEISQIFPSDRAFILDVVGDIEPILPTQEFEDEFGELRENIRNSVKDGLRQGLIDDDWGTALRSILATAITSAMDESLNNLADMLTNFLFGTGGKSSGGIFSAIFSAFGGAKAGGGPVKAGVAYIGGERGKELFVPNVNGNIITAADLNRLMSAGGAGGQAIDARTIIYGNVDSVTWPQLRDTLQANNQAMAARFPGAVNATLIDNRRQKRRL
jgi:tape measure domain-containing protein